MKITYIGHASLLVEARGIRILSDPWWAGPCFAAQWWNYPTPRADLATAAPPEYIYVSHGHNDHLHPATLRRLPKSATVVVSSTIDIADSLTTMGFSVLRLNPREPWQAADGLRIEISPTCSNDTIMVVNDGEEVLVNLNDALHSAPPEVQARVIADLRDRYGSIDYAFCGYAMASHFPNCFRVPGKDDEATAVYRQSFFNGQWSSIIHRLSPRFGLPFAGDVAILQQELIALNEPVHNADRPTERFRRDHPDARTIVFDIAPSFTIEHGAVTNEALFCPFSMERLVAEKSDDIAKANKITAPSSGQIEALAELIRRNVDLCAAFLSEFQGSYRAFIQIVGSSRGIAVEKNARSIGVSCADDDLPQQTYDVVFSTRFAYLRRALVTRYGHEIIFVGSGGLWTYKDRDTASRAIHRELATVLGRITVPPPSRFGDQAPWLYRLKSFVKRRLGREVQDSYDLDRWIVYQAEPTS